MVGKMGHPLSANPEIPGQLLDVLRERLSVTTAEEFLDIAGRFPEALKRTLGLDDSSWSRLIEASRATLSAAELEQIDHPPANDYPYFTGHDVPGDVSSS